MLSVSKREQTALQKAYHDLTQEMLKPYGVKTGMQLKGDDHKKFYAELAEAWKKKKASISADYASTSKVDGLNKKQWQLVQTFMAKFFKHFEEATPNIDKYILRKLSDISVNWSNVKTDVNDIFGELDLKK